MKKRILFTIVSLIILLALPFSMLISAFFIPAQYSESYLGVLPLKWERLKATESPRIVVAGGSGAAFATRSDLIERELPQYRAVNFGLYAGLGTAVMLDLCVPRLSSGDILIFEVELSGQTLSDYFGAEAMWQASEGNPELLAALPLNEYGGALIGALPNFTSAKARFWMNGGSPHGDGVYARDSFNYFGDIDCPGREQNRMPGGRDDNMPISFDISMVTDAFAEKVRDMAEKCEKKGVRFYFRFCPMNSAAISEEDISKAEYFEYELRERLNCSFLGGIEDAIMAPGWFFDTNFHLNESGAIIATASLIQDLKAELGDSTLLNIALPDIPEVSDVIYADGDDRDEEYFTYTETEDGFRITALSESGRGREELMIPSSHNGLPVTGFDGSVFAGNTVLRELTLQDNVRTIPDGAFKGCTALRYLIINNTRPETCSVGSGLLEDTDARILVPPESYGNYCTNYFWARYSDVLEPNGEAQTHQETDLGTQVQGRNSILYLSNGGRLRRGEEDYVRRESDSAHLRVNTLQGASWFVREGFVLSGWNTEPDGSGDHIGLGSRVDRKDGMILFAEWAQANPETDFIYETGIGESSITGYSGGTSCVVPETLGGLPVRRICSDAFDGTELEELVLPSSLRSIENGAFKGCSLGTVTIYDSCSELSESSFDDCTGPKMLRINAAVSPVYSGSYFDTFSDKYDWLLSIQDQKKIVLASGSSGRYGYDSEALHRAFPEYEIANMGVYAWSNMMPQLEIVRALMREGDILISAPEFDAVDEQFCVSNRLDAQFWAMMESDYDIVSRLDMGNYSEIWGSFAAYQKIRSGMQEKSYDVSPANYDDDGNYYSFPTYNKYGDFILPRPNAENDELHRHNIADYTLKTVTTDAMEHLNTVYLLFEEKGIRVFFSYTPRNRSSLTANSTSESRKELHEAICRTICVPVISDMDDYLLSGIYFWQIDSHTSTEGAGIRTNLMIFDLRNALDGRYEETGQP